MKKMTVLLSVAAALVAGAGVAFAQAPGAYLFDVLKEPNYSKAFAAMMSGAKHLPSWLREITGSGDYVATPETSASIGDVPYRLFHACKAHDCAGNELEVMFAPDAAKAYGLLVDGDKPRRWFGAPDADQQSALAKALQED